MTNYPYILFNQSPEQLRRIGARGGKAQARNRRARLTAQAQTPPPILAELSHFAGFAVAKPFRISEGYPRVFTTGKGCGGLF